MASLEPRSTHQYDRWIAAPPQAHDAQPESSVAAIHLARQQLLREHLAPLKQPVHDAVTKLHGHLQSINNALEAFLNTRERRSELLSRCSSLFNDLRFPPELATKTSEALLKEYMQLSNTAQSSEVSLGDAVSCLNALRQDFQELLKEELGDFMQNCERCRKDLLTLVNTAEPLTLLEELIDTKVTPAGQLLTTLRDRLLTLAIIISEMKLDAPLPDQLRVSLQETQATFTAIVEASSPYAPPYGKISSNHLVRAGLRESIRTIYPQLPKLVIEESTQPSWNLPTLTSDEKRAFLVVARHIDATTLNAANESDESLQAVRPEYQQLIDYLTSQFDVSGGETARGPVPSSSGAASQAEFRNTAQRERDELIDDMIRQLGISKVKALILSQAEASSGQHPGLITSLDSALDAAHARFEDTLLKIECEAGIAGDIARHLARLRINVIDLHTVSVLFKENPDLEICCANIVSKYQSMPSGSIDELRGYLGSLATTLSAAKNLSPLIFESLLDTPGEELATTTGVERKSTELTTLQQSPDKLRAMEVSLLTSLTASLLERHYPASDHSAAQYTVAAQIILLGLAPVMKNGIVERPVRPCKEVTKLLNRTAGCRLSSEIVHRTILGHLTPHVVVCKNQSKRNPADHEFQIAGYPADIFQPIIVHLHHLAQRASMPLKTSPTTQSRRVPHAHSTKALQSTTPSQQNDKPAAVVTQPFKSDYHIRTAHRNHLEQLAAFVEKKSNELSELRESPQGATEKAGELQSVLKRIEVLSGRLSSALQNNMARNALTSFSNSFDKRCFSTLRTLAGISPLATSASPQRSKSKAFDSKRINGIIFDCILEMYPFAKTSLERSKSLVTTLRDIEREVSSRKSILPPESTQKNLATLRSHLEDHSKLKPEGAASLGLLCAWVLDAEFRENIAESLTLLGNDIRAELSEFTDTQTTNVSSGDLLQSEEAERGTEHE